MDIIKEVRRQAAKEVTLWRVTVPSMILGSTCTILGMTSANIPPLSEFAPLLVSVGLCAVLFAVLGSCITYFFIQKSPKVLRKQLEFSRVRTEDEIRGLEKVLQNCRELIIQQEFEMTKRIKENFDIIFERQKVVFLKPLREQLDELRKRDEQATPHERVRNQQLYTRLPRVISDAEVKLQAIDALSMPKHSQELIEKSVYQAVLSVRTEGDKQIAHLETRISHERARLATIEDLLKNN